MSLADILKKAAMLTNPEDGVLNDPRFPTPEAQAPPMPPRINPALPTGVPVPIVAPEEETLAPRPLSPLEINIRNDEREIRNLQANGLPEDDSKKARLLRGIGEGLRAWQASGQQGGLGGALGSVLGGSVINTVSPKLDASMRTQNQLQQIGARLKSNIGLKDKQLEQGYKQAQIENIYADNEDNREWRRSQLEERKLARAERTKTQALSKLFSGQYYDPANPAHRELATAAGLNPAEMGRIDLRNPVTKQIGDTVFKYNRETGAFEDSGLPKDQAKSLVDFEVKMPDGKTYTYKVSQEKAAGFQTQMRAAGIQADLAERKFDYQKENDAANRAQATKLAQERIGLARENIAAAQRRLDMAEAKDKRQAEQAVRDEKQKLIRLKAFLKNSPFIDANDPLFGEIDELDK